MYNRKVTIKNQFKELATYQSRMFLAFILVVLLLLVLGVRVANLQINHYEKFRTASDNNRIRVQPIGPTRGLIFDRNGLILAENRSIHSLELIPEEVSDIEQTVADLQRLLSIDDANVERFWKEYRGSRSRFKKIPLQQKLSEKQMALFSVDRFKYPGVSVEARLIRHYPYGDKLVHALGYVGRINDRELKTIDLDNYRATRHIGKVGLEKFYEDTLHGTIGSQEVETDVQGRVLRVLSQTPPIAGDDIQLALDLKLQLKAVEVMNGQRGAVVALNPKTGGVLAMVSNPGYNPNLFVTGISNKDYQAILNSPDRPQFNRAIRGQYSPGSTIKPHLAWVGLENKTVYPSYSIEDKGVYFLPNDDERRYRDWQKNGHGNNVNYRMAIIRSCDIYFYDLAYKLGIDTIYESMTQFGFGQYTGIDMGEEVPGLMPSRDWKQGARGVRWFPGETVIIGIGQGYWTATPLQIANSVAVVANQGVRYQLRMVESVIYDGTHYNFDPVLADQQIDIGDGKHFKRIQDAMREVNHHPVFGTARTAFQGTSYVSAGKTGTVQLFEVGQDEEYEAENVAAHLRDNALYVGYAPFDDPQIAIAVVVENAGGGGSNAAPIARKIMDVYLNDSNNELAKQ